MPIYLRDGSSWKAVDDLRIRLSSAWSTIKEGYIWVSSAWKQFFSSENAPQIAQQVTISQSTDSEGFVTLTGTNYNWTNATSLTYYFEWSTNGGSSWSTINTGSIANPSVGSSNTKTYYVVSETSPNIDNLYRFRVFAQNVTLTTNSTSSSTIISTPRDITISFYSKTYNSITVEFATPAYAGSYNIKIGTSTYQAVTGTTVGGNTRVTATGLTSSTSHAITVRPYTGGLGSQLGVPYVKGYAGNESNSVTATTDAPPVPSQITRPGTPSGTGEAFTSVSAGTSGTYNNYSSITTYLHERLVTSSAPTDGLTTGSTKATPYKITQSDATYPQYTYYTVDAVLALDGVTTYFYYSAASVTSFIGSFTDNFNRSNTTSGFGTMTPAKDAGMSPSSYIYDFHQNPNINTAGQSWKILSNEAYNNYNVTQGDPGDNFSMYTIDVGRENVNIRANVPSQKGDNGLAFWVTARGSWYAVAPKYALIPSSNIYGSCVGGTSESISLATYNSTTTGCTGDNTATCTGYFSKTTSTSNIYGACTAGSSESISQTTYNSTTTGCTGDNTANCSGYYDKTQTNTPICGTCVGGYVESVTQSVYDATTTGCSGNNTCSCSGYFSKSTSTTPIYGSCVGGTAQSIDVTTYINTVTGCTGNNTSSCSGWFSTSTGTGVACTGSAQTPTCPTIGNNAGDRCGSCTTVTTYGSCKTPGANDPSGCLQNAPGYSPCGSGLVRCPSGTAQSYSVYQSTTTYFRSPCTANQTGSSTTYSRTYCTANQTGTSTTYSRRPCTANITGTSTTYSRTPCTANVTGTNPAAYKTYLALYSSISGTVTSELTEIASSTTSYNVVSSFVVSTSGSTISSTAYSASNYTSPYATTLSSTKSSATKSLNGRSGIGVIRTETATNGGFTLDDFQYTRV